MGHCIPLSFVWGPQPQSSAGWSGGGWAGTAHHTESMANPFHHDLWAARWIPAVSFGSGTSRLMRRLPPRPVTPGPGVSVDEVRVSGTVSLRVFRPTPVQPGAVRSVRGDGPPVPALLWIHGGGHLFGSPEQDDRANIDLVGALGIVVAAARYRAGAQAAAPASLEDCYAALSYLYSNAARLGIDSQRLAVGGASAGGGIAAGLAAYSHDRGEIPVAFQLLVYPMLDDRTVVRANLPAHLRMWTAKSNELGWRTYLGAQPGSAGVSHYAAPARRADLTGLPPAWIGVGTLDLFHDEDVEYARRLAAAGTRCELQVVPGAFHGFDQLFSKTPVVREFRRSQIRALRAAGITAAQAR